MGSRPWFAEAESGSTSGFPAGFKPLHAQGRNARHNGGYVKRSLIFNAILLCVVLCSAALGRASGVPATPNRIEITARRFAFAPAEITLKKGQPVVLVLKSADVAHGLLCRELDLDLKTNKGTATEARFTPDKTGTFLAHCAIFCGSGHGQMTLTIRVVE
jgi:cytochrome c oxidase subunit 2